MIVLFRFFSLYAAHRCTFEAKCGPSNRTGAPMAASRYDCRVRMRPRPKDRPTKRIEFRGVSPARLPVDNEIYSDNTCEHIDTGLPISFIVK